VERSVGEVHIASVSVDEAWTRLKSDARSVLIDVRTDVFAYLKGHLPGAEYLNTETLRASEGGIPTRLLSAGADVSADPLGLRRGVVDAVLTR